jgi:hypothetical protein
MNGRSANSLRAWGYLVAALVGVVVVERGVQAPSSEVTLTPPARDEVSGVTVALRVAPRAAPTPAPTVSLIDQVLRVGVGAVWVAPGWDEDVPRAEPEREEQDVRDAQIALEQQGQQGQQAQTERHEGPAPSRAEALCDRQGMRTEWYRAKHRMMWRCARG